MASSPCTAAGAAVGASPAHPACPLWQVIEALGQAISRTPGCVLLDVDAGASTNRTVYTFVGTPEAVVEGALSAARVAGQLIDMSQHTGEQPSAPSLGRAPASAGRKSRHQSAARGQTQCFQHCRRDAGETTLSSCSSSQSRGAASVLSLGCSRHCCCKLHFPCRDSAQSAKAAGKGPSSLFVCLPFWTPDLISAPALGEHPRMGALDVCPFVPVMNVSMEECVACAHVFGQRLSEELGVPGE